MLLNAQRLRNGDVADAQDLRRVGESLERSTWMQVKLIDDLLDVSRIVAGKLALELGPVDLRLVVRAAVDNLSDLVEAKGIAVKVAIDLNSLWSGVTACAFNKSCQTCSPTRSSSRPLAGTCRWWSTRTQGSRACS